MTTWTAREVLSEIKNRDVSEPWLVGVLDFKGSNYLRITAVGSWTAPEGGDGPCEPDGYAGIPIDESKTVIKDCPYGALIGRFGGGSAGFLSSSPPGSDGPFSLGKFSVIKIPSTTVGPLFIGFNCKLRPVKAVSLTLTVLGAVL